MTLKTRRILFIIFIIAFFTITPLVILYANGYKLSLQGKILQKTGMLVLDSNPKGAKIYINGKPKKLFLKFFNQKNNFIITPAKIKNVLPGDYLVKIEKNGYWAWEKKLTVKPGMATFAEDINLFKNKLPALMSSGKIINILISPDNKSLLVNAGDEAYFYNPSGDKKTILDAAISTSTDNFFWLNNNMALVNGLIFKTNDSDKLIDLNKYINFTNSKITNANGENELYYISSSNTINKFNILSKKNEKIVTSEKIDDFLTKDNNLYIINKISEKHNLRVYDIASKQMTRQINLPAASSYEFINPGHHLINLYDKHRQILYLIDPTSPDPLKESLSNIKIIHWVNENKLLYANDFEILLIDFSTNKTTLITRISEEIQNLVWHPSNNYVLYSTNDSIFSIELDDREKRNITQLIKFDKISNLILDKSGKILYFYAKIGNQKGLYKLNIQ